MMFGHYPTDILLSLSVFAISLWMLLIFRTNIILVIFNLELLLLSNILGFMISSAYLNDITGEIFSIFIITIAAIETAIALCIILSYYRITNKNIQIIANPGFYSLTIPAVKQFDIPEFQLPTFTIIIDTFTLCLWLSFMFYIWVWAPYVYLLKTLIPILYNLHKLVFEPTPAIKDWYAYRVFLHKYGFQLFYANPDYKIFKMMYLKRRPWLDKIVASKKLANLEKKEDLFWSAMWSVVTFEFLPRRANKLYWYFCKTYLINPPPHRYIESFRAPIWRYRRYHGYLNYVAPNTIVGDRILDRIRSNKEQKIRDEQYAAELLQHQQTIERLEAIIRVKDATLDTKQRQF